MAEEKVEGNRHFRRLLKARERMAPQYTKKYEQSLREEIIQRERERKHRYKMALQEQLKKARILLKNPKSASAKDIELATKIVKDFEEEKAKRPAWVSKRSLKKQYANNTTKN